MDGEGATKLGTAVVTGAKTYEDAQRVAQTIAQSSLFKYARSVLLSASLAPNSLVNIPSTCRCFCCDSPVQSGVLCLDRTQTGDALYVLLDTVGWM